MRVNLQGWAPWEGIVQDEFGVGGDAPYVLLRDIKGSLLVATKIEKLMSDEGFVRDLLTKLSWLAVLLASAAFAAGRSPPGGWKDGGLPSCSSAAHCPAGSQDFLRRFFVLDLLTFGFAAALVLYLVACAVPQTGQTRRDAAVRMYVSLWIAALLLSAAVGCGMGALWAGVLAVYPSEFVVVDVWVPLAVSAGLLLAAACWLVARLCEVYPGPRRHRSSLAAPEVVTQ